MTMGRIRERAELRPTEVREKEEKLSHWCNVEGVGVGFAVRSATQPLRDDGHANRVFLWSSRVNSSKRKGGYDVTQARRPSRLSSFFVSGSADWSSPAGIAELRKLIGPFAGVVGVLDDAWHGKKKQHR